jgi:glutathionylspermidine synthase
MALGAPVEPALFARIRRRTIFEHCKWDPQVGDTAILADHAILLDASAWREVSRLAECLAAEAMTAEQELLGRTDLHGTLGIPPRIRKVLARAAHRGPRTDPRVVRFDFHYTRDGWRIAEANSDVPGGFIEASGFTQRMAEQHEGLQTCGDPAAALAVAVAASTNGERTAALVHATAYTDDVQVMAYIGQHLERCGVRAILTAPDAISWKDGRAVIRVGRDGIAADALVRFFPAEWLPNLPRSSHWHLFFGGTDTPMCNPGSALLVQTKRFPLVWSQLRTPLTNWRALLPETRDPREVAWRREAGWVLKPAFGRVGEAIGIVGVTDPKEWRQIARSVRWNPGQWVAQRRFDELPVPSPQGPVFVCLGVYTVDGRAAGAYGRIADRPLTDSRSRDAAVLVRPEAGDGT